MAPRQEGTGEEDAEGEEQRLRAALRHLQAEAGVLERLVYKHRNQHRGAAYFQYLLKVRRDLKLLVGAGLGEVLNAVFPVLSCRKPANTVLLPNRQSKRKPGANYSHYERLLGIARLLSQMAEPVMMGAVKITFLLAKSFFVDLCTALLALLARVRVLTQQMLLDVVSVYNKVTDLTDSKQSVKISVGGAQAFREYYPSSSDTRKILECTWVKDKFVLHERTKGSAQKAQDEDKKSFALESSIQYETLGAVHEVDKCAENENPEELKSPTKQQDAALANQPETSHSNDAEDFHSGTKLVNENSCGSLPTTLATHVHSTPRPDLKPETRKRVAFIAVGKPNVTVRSSGTGSWIVHKKQKLDVIPNTDNDKSIF